MTSSFDPNVLQRAPEILSQVKAEKARRDFKEFVRQAWHIIEPGTPLVWGWVMDAICDHLQALAEGRIPKNRLLICVPPGSSKSRLVRVFFPCWVWARQSHTRFISASYALDLTIRDNLDTRRIVTSDWYKETFKLSIAEDDGGKVGFSLSTLGSLKALTVGGKTTGFRGDYFLIDDPLNAQDANSDVLRADTNEWFREAAQSRVNSVQKSAIVVVMQRLHEEDVAAIAMRMGYERLIVPMRWDEQFRYTTSIGWTDPRSEEGELMWPERFPATYVDEQEDAETGMGPYAFASQMQQTPVPRTGGLIPADNFKIIDDLPDEPFLSVRGWDLAGTEGAGAYTVGTKLLYGLHSEEFYVADVQRARLNGAGVRKLMLSTAELDGRETRIIFPKDPGQAGKAQSEDLVAMLAGFSVESEAQTGSKEMRAEPFASQVATGRVNVLKRDWTRAFMDEMRLFPRGKFKDQVDATASAFNKLAPLTRAKRKKAPVLVLVGETETSSFPIVANSA
jgi:predicted phage terminase large subunit-like protein